MRLLIAMSPTIICTHPHTIHSRRTLLTLYTPLTLSHHHPTHILTDNAIPVKSWFNDPHDTALLDLLPMLDALRFSNDVRSVLSRNLHLHNLW